MSYLGFIRDNFRFIGFGILMMGFSSFGQTFFIALFNPDLMAHFNLNNAEIGGIYSIATLVSAFLLIWTGPFVDRVALPRFAGFVTLGLALSCLVMSFASHVVILFLAFLLLRHFGQGLTMHTAGTAIARAYDKNRGRAVALTGIGLPLGEGFFPLIAVLLAGWVGWQTSWLYFAVFSALLVFPLAQWLARSEPKKHPVKSGSVAADNVVPDAADRDFTRAEMLRDWRFYPVLTYVLSSPLILTGLFFQQTHLAIERGWALSTLAAGFTAYAAVKILAALFTGTLIDRFTAARVLPFTALPLIAALAFILLAHNLPERLAVFIYMGLIGLNVGSISAAGSSLWPELYGTRNLGAIKSVTGSVFIFATSVTPWLSGQLLDMGWGFDNLVVSGLAYLAFCFPAVLLALYTRPAKP